MRLKIILGTALSALLLASSLAQAESQPTTQLATAETTPPAPSQVDTNQAQAQQIVWYSDPIALGLAVFALFAAIDIAILFAKNSHHTSNRHALH
jgi:hypothetical protein